MHRHFTIKPIYFHFIGTNIFVFESGLQVNKLISTCKIIHSTNQFNVISTIYLKYHILLLSSSYHEEISVAK